jgi:hypothetical protein
VVQSFLRVWVGIHEITNKRRTVIFLVWVPYLKSDHDILLQSSVARGLQNCE